MQSNSLRKGGGIYGEIVGNAGNQVMVKIRELEYPMIKSKQFLKSPLK
jgi:hypothetical protein